MLPFLIRFACLLALALWVGGGAAISFLVAPAVFARAGSRRLAGDIVGSILRRLDLYVAGVGPIAGGTLLLELLRRPASRPLAVALGLVGGMIALWLYSRLALTPRISRLRAELGDEIDRLPRDEPRRKAFGRLHGFSVLCLLGQLLLGAGALAGLAAGAP